MIGKWLAATSSGRVQRAFVRLLGVPDFHTHLRLAPLRRAAAGVRGQFCELGCGSGISLIEVLLHNREATGIGFEVDTAALAQARIRAEQLGLSRQLAFRQLDLTGTIPGEVCSADCVLLLDVLEHLPDVERIAAAVAGQLKAGARVLVSVPTPLYPKIFGRSYHRSIGHLHDGFTLGQVDQLLSGLERTGHRYSTGPLSWMGALLCYRWGARFAANAERTAVSRAIAWIAALLAAPFRFVDFWNGGKISCSVFVEYHKGAVHARDERHAVTGSSSYEFMR